MNEAMKDKNGRILKTGDMLVDAKGKLSRLENICGVTMLRDLKNSKCTIIRKVDMSTLEYTDEIP